jgi:hypothetical protein
MVITLFSDVIICPQNTSMLCIEDECGMQIINPAPFSPI